MHISATISVQHRCVFSYICRSDAAAPDRSCGRAGGADLEWAEDGQRELRAAGDFFCTASDGRHAAAGCRVESGVCSTRLFQVARWKEHFVKQL